MLVPGQHLFVSVKGGGAWMYGWGIQRLLLLWFMIERLLASLSSYSDALPCFVLYPPGWLGREFTKLGPQDCQVWDRVPKRDANK